MQSRHKYLVGVPTLILLVGCLLILSLSGRTGADDERPPVNHDTLAVATMFDVVYTNEHVPGSLEPEEAARHLLGLASWEVRRLISTEWSPLTEDDLDEEVHRRMEDGIIEPFTEEMRLIANAYNRALEIIKAEEIDDPADIRKAFEQARSGIDEFPGYYLEALDTTVMDEEAWRGMVEGTILFQGDRRNLAPMVKTEEEHLELHRASMANLLSGAAYVDPLIDAHRLMESKKNLTVARGLLEANPGLDRSLDETLRIMLQEREFELLQFRMIEEHLIVHDETVAAEIANILTERREQASDLQNFATRPLNPMR